MVFPVLPRRVIGARSPTFPRAFAWTLGAVRMRRRVQWSDAVTEVLYESNLKSLPLLHRGKVRDIYAAGDRHMLIVTTDRLSAFDVVLPTPIPGKGEVLTSLSNFWFARTRPIVPNHLANRSLAEVLGDPAERRLVEGRGIVVRRLAALPVEAIVRGYLAGSGWKEYRQTGTVCGIALPAGLREADRLPEPILRRRRKPRSARTMRTSALPRRRNCSAPMWPGMCKRRVSRSISMRLGTRWAAGLSSRILNSNLGWTTLASSL